ncbi:MAG TPA: Asp-tRNA(Asn)/Glu-tRNA(Gln) amidotransferase subunit GatB [Vicinamibacterales bacterium]|nr:Asp-tRNA(Asn)/Glu-tRNA(Gln) amidotransferase subunit GatB [Vicinamibacterales bacterium]
MNRFEAVIGLEIHAQLLTATKIFCGCPTSFGSPPNTNVCPVCLGFPGALPVLNRAAVDFAVRAALALGCAVQERSVFARKNYFYPDLPKGYQISQFELPLALGGGLDVVVNGETTHVRLTRIHMEEDAGKSLHEGFPDSDRRTYLDYNRAGVPLIEIVSEPDMRSSAEAAAFFEKLRQILVWLGVNDGNMDEGSLRCDANVSIRRVGETALGTKAEVKNVNSFRYLQKALEYEIERQIDVIEHGGRVVQETRLFDSAQGRTLSMRSKEEAHDYRYFPEPDLPPLIVDAARRDRIAQTLTELPESRKARFVRDYGLPGYDADLLTQTRGIADFFETTAQASGNAKAASNWVMGEVLRTMKERTLAVEQVPLTPAALAGLIAQVDRGTISSTVAKDVFAKMLDSGRSAQEIVDAEGLAQTSDVDALTGIVRDAVAANPDAVAQVRKGRNNAFGFLVGHVMKASKGKANPKVVNDLLKKELGM